MRPHRTLAALALAVALLAAGGAAGDGQSWLAVREISLEVPRGSPLDFSRMLPSDRIDASRRVVTGTGGNLAFADTPGRPVRFHCASLAWSPASGGFPDKATTDRYVRQLVQNGYNMARLLFIDASLMVGRVKDFDFDPEVLDRIHYLMAALKRNGIHWMIDGMSSWHGAYGGLEERWDPAGTLKLAVHFDQAAFAHWHQLQQRFLARVNPYTGIAPIHDEALALVILVNENGLEFESVVQDRPGKPAYDAMIVRSFNGWLARRYGTTEALAKAWGDLARNERLGDGSIRLPRNRYVHSVRLRDLQAFFMEVEQDTAARMSTVLRDLGYKGLISTYNNWPTIQTANSRRGLEAVTMNTYHDWVGGYAPGSKLLQTSATADGANFIRMIAAARWLGRPFLVSEYDHLFWNRYRFESNVLMPAYAALQGWDVVCRHAHGPLVLAYGEPYPHKRAMLPYAIALDPVARAGETLAALLYRRGDVSPSRLTIPFLVRGEADLSRNMQAREPEDLTRLALVGRIGLQDVGKADRPVSVVQPRDRNDMAALIRSLRQGKALATNNPTDPLRGVFQSDTTEITLDERAQQIRVVTRATEAVAYSALKAPLTLDLLTISRARGDAMVALSALDPKPSLAESNRFLLIFATDARNTGMRFRDRDEKVIEDFGTLPVLIRKGEVELQLRRSARHWQVSPVGLDGRVKSPVTKGTGPVAFRLSNDLPSGPTTYFLLELQPD
jgi:hypothetical protein